MTGANVTIEDPTTVVTVEGDDITVSVESSTVSVELGASGPQGATGIDGGTTEATAATALGGHRVVRLVGSEATYASNTTSGDLTAPLGVTEHAAIEDDSVTVRTHGVITEGSWSWTPGGLVFLSTNGLLTQTAPTAPAFQRVIGNAISATSILVDPQPGIGLT